MLLQQKVDGEDVLNRSQPVLVDDTVYREDRLVHIEPPVNTRAPSVVDFHQDQALHKWQGF